MGVVNLKWRVAMSSLGTNFTKAEQDKGWPDTLIPGQLAALQYPYTKGDRAAYKLAGDRAKDIEDACLDGSIQFTQATRQTKHQITVLVPGDARFATRNVYGEREVHYRQQLTWVSKEVQVNTVTAPAFAAWLAAQGETPSPHVQAWFDAMGVAGAGQTDAPVDDVNTAPSTESLYDRNLRWLNEFETEERIAPRGAIARASKRLGVDRSTFGKAVDKARTARAERKRAGIKPVPTKAKATAFSGLGVTTVRDGKKITTKQR